MKFNVIINSDNSVYSIGALLVFAWGSTSPSSSPALVSFVFPEEHGGAQLPVLLLLLTTGALPGVTGYI